MKNEGKRIYHRMCWYKVRKDFLYTQALVWHRRQHRDRIQHRWNSRRLVQYRVKVNKYHHDHVMVGLRMRLKQWIEFPSDEKKNHKLSTGSFCTFVERSPKIVRWDRRFPQKKNILLSSTASVACWSCASDPISLSSKTIQCPHCSFIDLSFTYHRDVAKRTFLRVLAPIHWNGVRIVYYLVHSYMELMMVWGNLRRQKKWISRIDTTWRTW